MTCGQVGTGSASQALRTRRDDARSGQLAPSVPSGLSVLFQEPLTSSTPPNYFSVYAPIRNGKKGTTRLLFLLVYTL